MTKPPILLISPTAFKGTLSPIGAARIIRRAVRNFNRPVKTLVLPLADGGDGTLEVLVRALNAKIKKTIVTGPLGKRIAAFWGLSKGSSLIRGKTAIIEMARASGLALIRGKNKPLDATSQGTGELITAALNAGAKNIFIGVGGTASSDGGAGALSALGLRYFDRGGHRLPPCPRHLIRLARVDWKNFDPRIFQTKIYVMCDVKNPLLGRTGSARTFGPQKGAMPSQVKFLEKFLKNWSTFARRPIKNNPGAGAAGALAFGLSGFAGARLVEGAPFVMKTLGWGDHIEKATGIITGEGRMDNTSLMGKVIGSISHERKGRPLYVVCGENNLSAKASKRAGIRSVLVMGKEGLKNPAATLYKATRKLIGENF